MLEHILQLSRLSIPIWMSTSKLALLLLECAVCFCHEGILRFEICILVLRIGHGMRISHRLSLPGLSGRSWWNIRMYCTSNRRWSQSDSWLRNRNSCLQHWIRAKVPLTPKVLVDLSIEGEGPCWEVDPANDLDNDFLPIFHDL